MIFSGYLLSLFYGIFCIGISVIAHKLGVKSAYTRKITHILIGFEWVILQKFFGSSIHFIIVCLIFTAVVSVMHITGIVPSLKSKEENSRGTIYYCVAMTVMSIIVYIFPQMMIPFGVGVFCTSMGDGFAGVLGIVKKHNKVIYGNKTLFGFFACLGFSFLSITLLYLAYDVEMNLIYVALIAVFASVLELFAKKGIDNVTVTLGTALLSYFLINFPTFILYYILPLIFTIPIVSFVYSKKALTTHGIIAALMLDIISSISFGNIGFVILVVFFGGSLIADRFKKDTNNHREERTVIQVLANGSLGIVFSIANMIYPSKIWLVAFTAVFAEALADTAASGVGSRSTVVYDLFRGRRVEPGTSGGMSILGTASALISSIVVSLVAMMSKHIGIIEGIIITASGFVGSVLDSLYGSYLQGKYKCLVCKKHIESKIHCDEKADKLSGFDWINNSTVNFFSTMSAAMISIILVAFV